MKLEIVGGPFDGAVAAPSRPGAFFYVEQMGGRYVCRSRAGRGVLHRVGLALRAGGVVRVLKHAPGYAECPGCHAFHVLGAGIFNCTLCGSPLHQPLEHSVDGEAATHRGRQG